MKLLVIGDSCIDKFVYGLCDRICPEAPVPVFTPKYVTKNGGMASNVQENVRALGVDCDIITNGKQMPLKTRYVDDKTNQLLLRVDDTVQIAERFDSSNVSYNEYDAILISDYNKGFIDEDQLHDICDNHDFVLLDVKKKLRLPLPPKLKYLKVNEYEWDLNRDHLEKTTDNLIDRLIITRGGDGCEYRGVMRPPPKTREVQDLSGAGDTFLAAFAVSCALGDTVPTALQFAMECASIVVSKRGVSTVEGSSIKTIKQCIVSNIN